MRCLDDQTVAELIELGTHNPQHAWASGDPIDHIRNAHYTNTLEQLRFALGGPFNSLEADVRLRGGVPVTAHDRHSTNGILFADWARVVVASGRVLRIDVKERWALEHVVATLDALAVPDDRVVINVTALWPRRGVSLRQLRTVRRRWPDLPIGLNAHHPNRLQLRLLRWVARTVGGPFMVAIEERLATPALIACCRPELVVGAWNDARHHDVLDIAEATRRLRGMGVDGMIDLRRTGDPLAQP